MSKKLTKLTIEQYVSISKGLSVFNFVMFLVGAIGVWLTTHNWLALLFTWIASVSVRLPYNYLRGYDGKQKKDS